MSDRTPRTREPNNMPHIKITEADVTRVFSSQTRFAWRRRVIILLLYNKLIHTTTIKDSMI